MSDFQITEEVIDAVVRYMKIVHPESPEKATREYARAMLEYTKSGLHKVARNNPDDIEAMFEGYEQSKNQIKDSSI